jgi:hypothetical protein
MVQATSPPQPLARTDLPLSEATTIGNKES